MNIIRLMVLATCAVATIPGERAVAGPSWVEDNDAGHVPGTSQKTSGNGPISSISGSIDPAANVAAGIPDFVDMYLIYIVDPANFSAYTIQGLPTGPGSADFDSQLWLFDERGRGILANDDAFPGQTGSLLMSPANDATHKAIPGPGRYFLAISAFDTDPASAEGLIFNQQERTEISGPDGPGGMREVVAWGSSPQGGQYLIGLTGVIFPPEIPAVSTWGMVVLFCAIAVAGTICVRRQLRVNLRTC